VSGMGMKTKYTYFLQCHNITARNLSFFLMCHSYGQEHSLSFFF